MKLIFDGFCNCITQYKEATREMTILCNNNEKKYFFQNVSEIKDPPSFRDNDVLLVIAKSFPHPIANQYLFEYKTQFQGSFFSHYDRTIRCDNSHLTKSLPQKYQIILLRTLGV